MINLGTIQIGWIKVRKMPKLHIKTTIDSTIVIETKQYVRIFSEEMFARSQCGDKLCPLYMSFCLLKDFERITFNKIEDLI